MRWYSLDWKASLPRSQTVTASLWTSPIKGMLLELWLSVCQQTWESKAAEVHGGKVNLSSHTALPSLSSPGTHSSWETSPQPRWKWSWWQMGSWDRKCKGNECASASSFELWRYLASISGTIYFTCICDFVFICFSSLSITLAVKIPVSGRFTIRGNISIPKKKYVKTCIFLHWGQYSRNPPLSLLTEMQEKERQRSNCLPSITLR